MSPATPLRRHVSITVGASTLDVAAGPDHTIASALAAYAIPFDDQRFAIIDSDGAHVPGSTTLAELDDGAHVSVIDQASRVQPAGRRGAHRSTTGQRADHGVLWWMLASAGAVLSLTLLVLVASGADDAMRGTKIALGAVLGIGALASAFAAPRASATSAPIALASATLLAFAAGAAVAPESASPLSLSIVFGLTSAAVVMATLASVARATQVRAMAGTVATITLIYAVVWALSLAFDWPAATAAAVSLGMVAPGLKVLPATLLNVAEGYLISYRHFMSQRWSVRGEVPTDPGAISMAAVAPMLQASHSRLIAGTATLSGAAVLFTPGVLTATTSTSLLVKIGAWAALLFTITVLALLPRNAPLAALRWTPRVAATLMAVQIGWFAAHDASTTVRTITIGVVFFAALLAAAMIVPLGRGIRSLSWSRLTDAVEGLAAVLALPAAFLAADMLELVRVAMAG